MRSQRPSQSVSPSLCAGIDRHQAKTRTNRPAAQTRQMVAILPRTRRGRAGMKSPPRWLSAQRWRAKG